MKRIKINENIDFSQIIYGMWRLADGEINDAKSVTDKINLCLDQGITTFDQADIYGDYSAEALFGIALNEDKSLRNKIEIVTKCGIVAPCGKYADVPVKYYDTSKKHIDASVNASLKNMNIDYIDMLLIHRPDPYMDHDETGQALDLETSYWNGTAWATKTSRPTAYHVWESGGWVESEDLKDVIRGHIVLQIKQYREYLLVQCDWTQLPDSPLTDEKKAEWATYRQVLRDYPANNVGATDFDALTWPTLPS